MSSTNIVTLLVHEDDDGSETYYQLSTSHALILSRIHAKQFKFNRSTITCDDNSVKMDTNLIAFLNRFRYGRYTTKWDDIAERLPGPKVGERRCLPHEYWVTLSH